MLDFPTLDLIVSDRSRLSETSIGTQTHIQNHRFRVSTSTSNGVFAYMREEAVILILVAALCQHHSDGAF